MIGDRRTPPRADGSPRSVSMRTDRWKRLATNTRSSSGILQLVLEDGREVLLYQG